MRRTVAMLLNTFAPISPAPFVMRSVRLCAAVGVLSLVLAGCGLLGSDEASAPETAEPVEAPVELAPTELAFVSLVDDGYGYIEATCVVETLFADAETDADLKLKTPEEGVALAVTANACAAPLGPKTESLVPGLNDKLDELWAGCSKGSGAACTQLYAESPEKSDYERFGETCGGRLVVSANCGVLLDGQLTLPDFSTFGQNKYRPQPS